MRSRPLQPLAFIVHIILIALLTHALAHAAQRRTALVIGNANYEVGQLRNPINDATDMSAALKQLGFDVITLKDANHEEMEDAVDEFNQRLRQGGLGLFYYAGHGVQVQGENYLIPIDARLKRQEDVRYKTLALGQVLGALKDARNQLNLVLLDACRDNPFTQSWRSSTQGLAVVAAARGTLIGYAAGPGEKAADGRGRNGTYTEHLLKHMSTPGIPVEWMLKRVRATVDTVTKGEQTPWTHSSLIGDIYLAGAPTESPASVPRPNPKPKQVAALNPEKARLTIRATPSDSRIRIMNINPRYRPGIELEPGQYDILVDRKGYHAKRQWVMLRDQDVVVDMTLDRVAVGIYPSAPKTTARPTRIRNSLGMVFTLIPAGEFRMGSNSTIDDEKPVHTVRLTKPFYLGETEVTQPQWEAVMGSNPSRFKGGLAPVESVTWIEVQTFIRRLNSRGMGTYRLPTEAEWEYAARAGTTTSYHFGDSARKLDTYAWYRVNSGDTTHAVNSKYSNAWGLKGMYGNVSEWVSDWYSKTYYQNNPQVDPTGPSRGAYRVMRGGNWAVGAPFCRAAFRSYGSPVSRYNFAGFRLLREVN